MRPFRPSKARGQNFLVDPNLARKFVAALAPGPGDLVLEVGPGKGALTLPLLATGCRVVAVELEAALADELEGLGEERLTLVRGDFTQLAAGDLEVAGALPTLALSNVPYSVTGAVLTRLLMGQLPLERFVVGVQREVADRLVAPPGSRTYGSLSVLARAFGELRRCFAIPPQAYRPRPKVTSAAVRAVRDPASPRVVAGGLLERLLRAAFGERRKTLANTLSSRLGQEKSLVVGLLERAGVDPGRRAETLSLVEFRRLEEIWRADGLESEAGFC